jgi:hypothetical protein
MNTEHADKPSAEERIHHPFSPSTLQCREACPDYDSAFTASEAATVGTKQHNMAETGIDDETLPDAKAMAVVECMKFVDERFAKYPGGKLIKEDYLPVDDEVILSPAGVPFTGTTAGYLDVGIVSADETALEVIDFKYGQVAVEKASNNLQGMAYLLGLKKKYPKATKGTVWFIMPHRDEITGAEFDLTTQSGGMYLRIKTVVHRAIEAHKEPRTFVNAKPTEGSCLFCSNLGRCPKVADMALKLGKKYAPLQIPESVSTTVFKDPADLERGLKFAAVIKVWAEAFRTQATAKTVDSPNFIPKGYDLVEMSKRKLLSPRKLADLAKTFLPEDKRDLVEKLFDIPIGKVEELINAAAPRGQKEATVQAFGEKALADGIVEMGTPFAFLRQSKKAAAE